MRSIPVAIAAVAFLVLLSGCERAVSFSQDIQPILAENCVSCHNPNAEGFENSGLDLGDHAGVMKGTKFGPIVVAGSSDSSTFYLVVAHKTDPKIHMPPHHEDALAEGRGFPITDAQIADIALWIDQGALDN